MAKKSSPQPSQEKAFDLLSLPTSSFSDLAADNELFHILAQSTAASIFIMQGAQMHFVNAHAEKMTGYTMDELLEMNFWDLIHPDHREMVKERGLARQRGEDVPNRYQVKILNAQGETRWIDYTATNIEYQEAPAVLGTAFDITTQVESQKALQSAEEKYRLLTEASVQGIAIFQDGRFVYANPAMSEINGYSLEEMLAFNTEEILAITYPDDQPLALQRYQGRMAGKEIDSKFRYRIICKNGNVRWIEATVTDIEYEGQPAQLATNIDITEKKAAEAALRNSEAQLRALIEHAPEAIVVLDIETGKIISASGNAENLFGVDPEGTSRPASRESKS